MKKIVSPFIMFFIMSCLWCSMAGAAVSTTVSTNKVSRGQHSIVSVTYRFNGITNAVTTLTSTRGVFYVVSATGSVAIGTVNTPITVPIAGRGRQHNGID